MSSAILHYYATPSTMPLLSWSSLQPPHGSLPSSPSPEEESSAQRGRTNRICEEIASRSGTLHGRRWQDNRTVRKGSCACLQGRINTRWVTARTLIDTAHSILIRLTFSLSLRCCFHSDIPYPFKVQWLLYLPSAVTCENLRILFGINRTTNNAYFLKQN